MCRHLRTGFIPFLIAGFLIAPGFGADLKQELKKAETGIRKGSQTVEHVVKSGTGKVKSTFKKGGSQTKKAIKPIRSPIKK